MSNAILRLLAEDKKVISYRPAFVDLTNDVRAAILLQQIVYWSSHNHDEAFYKFKMPSQTNHESYREGDSWCEELAFSRWEFDAAIKVIGTKITKGMKKSDILTKEIPVPEQGETAGSFTQRLSEMVKCLVVYWTDGNRVTWWQLNTNLLPKVVEQLYISKVVNLRYMKKLDNHFTYVTSESNFILFTETTTETTTDSQPSESPTIIEKPKDDRRTDGLEKMDISSLPVPEETIVNSDVATLYDAYSKHVSPIINRTAAINMKPLADKHGANDGVELLKIAGKLNAKSWNAVSKILEVYDVIQSIDTMKEALKITLSMPDIKNKVSYFSSVAQELHATAKAKPVANTAKWVDAPPEIAALFKDPFLSDESESAA